MRLKNSNFHICMDYPTSSLSFYILLMQRKGNNRIFLFILPRRLVCSFKRSEKKRRTKDLTLILVNVSSFFYILQNIKRLYKIKEKNNSKEANQESKALQYTTENLEFNFIHIHVRILPILSF